MNFIPLIGYLAGILTTISFLPQVIKIWQSKSAKDISLLMFTSFCAGVFLWMVYGLLVRDFPIILTNLITLLLAGTILRFKFKYDLLKK